MQDEWEFEWDPRKSATNARKHGISFDRAKAMWDDPYMVDVFLQSDPEPRWAVIAQTATGHYTAIITYRGERVVRIISVRRSSKKEVDIYAGH